jgi:hypothetical protein
VDLAFDELVPLLRIRHGLTAETVIGALEDAEEYKAFEAAIIADHDAQSAVERELVLRLAAFGARSSLPLRWASIGSVRCSHSTPPSCMRGEALAAIDRLDVLGLLRARMRAAARAKARRGELRSGSEWDVQPTYRSTQPEQD